MTPLLQYTIYYIRHPEKKAPRFVSASTLSFPAVVHREGCSPPPHPRVINIGLFARIPISFPPDLPFQDRTCTAGKPPLPVLTGEKPDFNPFRQSA